MQIWMMVAGIIVIGVVLYDALTTTLVASTAGGPVTSRIGHGLWSAAKRISPGPRSPVLTAAGPVILLVTVAVWMALLWLGWWLLFSADPGAVVSSATQQPASGWDRVYYTGYTIFTLGNGDFQPVGAPWQVATALAVANGLFLATMAITYLIPVLTAVTERRQQSDTITGLGATGQELVTNAWDGTTLRFLEQPLLRFASEINRTAQRHLTYPILHFFHSRTRADEFAVSVAALDEALTLVTLAVDPDAQPHPVAVRSARDAIHRLVTIIDASFHDAADKAPPPPSLDPLRARGVPVVDDGTFHARLEDLASHRRRVAGLVASSTWPWDEAATVLP